MKVKTIALGTMAALAAGSLAWRWASRRWQLPCPAWLAWLLDNPWTEAMSGAQTTLDRIGLQPGERGLDVGSGPGRLSIPAARRVGPAGEIVALDIQPGMLDHLQQQAAEAGVTNIVAQLGDIATDESLPPDHFDRAWLVTALGEIPNREAALRNVYRVLKPGGTLSITEVLFDPHYQTRRTVLRRCQAAGFVPAGYWGNVFAFTQNFSKPEG